TTERAAKTLAAMRQFMTRSRDVHRLAAGARRQRRQNRRGGVAKEFYRTIRKKEMRPARMEAPEVKHVALVAQIARTEGIWAARTSAGIASAKDIDFRHAE